MPDSLLLQVRHAVEQVRKEHFHRHKKDPRWRSKDRLLAIKWVFKDLERALDVLEGGDGR